MCACEHIAAGTGGRAPALCPFLLAVRFAIAWKAALVAASRVIAAAMAASPEPTTGNAGMPIEPLLSSTTMMASSAVREKEVALPKVAAANWSPWACGREGRGGGS